MQAITDSIRGSNETQPRGACGRVRRWGPHRRAGQRQRAHQDRVRGRAASASKVLAKYGASVNAFFSPREAISQSILGPAPQEQAFFPSDIPGPPVLTPTSHGNGFANTGFLGTDSSTTTLPPSGKLKFTTPGVYHYICLVHDFMKGTIVVQQ